MSIFFKSNTLNIFCDASIKNLDDGVTIGCPSTIVVQTFNNGKSMIINQEHSLYSCVTNNSSEILAILLGVNKAIFYKKYFDTINLFSDSKVSIFGLREWVFNWVANIVDGKIYSSSGTLVSSQVIFLKIIKNILDNDMKINLYHQKSHVNTLKERSLLKAKSCFFESNGIVITKEDLLTICLYNNYVDNLSTSLLHNVVNVRPLNQMPIYFIPKEHNMVKYNTLINRIGG